MRLYLSGVIENLDYLSMNEKQIADFLQPLNILQSYFSFADKHRKYQLMCRRLMIDSGAFSMMSKMKKDLNVIDYAKKYAAFIKTNNIDCALELDIESVFGWAVRDDCLHLIQDVAGVEPIRVWHKARGIDYWRDITSRFDFVCIGGIVTGELSLSRDRALFHYLLKIARENDCKVHALGVSSRRHLLEYNFDSTDSADYLLSVRTGCLRWFNGHDIINLQMPSIENKQYESSMIKKISLLQYTDYAKYLEQF